MIYSSRINDYLSFLLVGLKQTLRYYFTKKRKRRKKKKKMKKEMKRRRRLKRLFVLCKNII